MKSRTFASILAALGVQGLCFQGPSALAQDLGTDLTLPAEQELLPAATCFQLISPATSCLIVSPTVINPSAPSFTIVDLNGAWADMADHRPYIYIYGEGNPIFVDMSLTGRPDGFGFFEDNDTIVVLFPDDQDYTGTLIDSETILWSNNTVWRKL